MSFPTQGIIDSGTGATETPVGNNWTPLAITLGTAGFSRSGSKLIQGASPGDAYLNAFSPGPDIEAYADIDTLPAVNEDFRIYYGLDESTKNGYVLLVKCTGTGAYSQRMFRVNAGVLGSQIGSTSTQTLAVGDSIGIERTGSSHQMKYKSSGGSWANLGAAGTDATYSAAGRTALGFNSSSAKLTNVGTGTIGAKNQTIEVGHAESSGSSNSLTLPIYGVRAGDVIAIAFTDNGNSSPSFSDSAGGNTYTARGPTAVGTTGLVVYEVVVTNVMTSITITGFTCTVRIARAIKINGVQAFDVVADTFGTSTTPNSGNTATLAQADEFVIGFVAIEANTSWAPGSGYTDMAQRQTSGTVWGLAAEWKTVAATTAVAATGTLGASSTWSAHVLTYKNGTAGATRAIAATINSTSSMTGSVVRVRPIAPSITATSGTVAAVVRNRQLTVSSIAATSAVSMSPARIRPIALIPGSPISATSAVIITFGRVRHITASITTTSGISASLNRSRLMVPAAVQATSGLVASIVRFFGRVIGIDGIAATSPIVVMGAPPITLTSSSNMGVLLRRVDLVFPAIAATSSMAATIRRFIKPFTGVTIAATSILTVFYTRIRAFSPSLSANSNVSVSIRASRRIGATAAATSPVSIATIGRIRPLVTTVAATSSIANLFIPAIRDFGVSTIASTSNVTALVGRVRQITALVQATSGVTARIVRQIRIGTTVAATSSIVAFVVRVGALAPQITAASTMSASVRRLRGISASATATSTVTTSLVRVVGISPTATATSNVILTIVRQRALVATLSANSNVQADLVRTRSLSPFTSSTSNIGVGLIFVRAVNPTLSSSSLTTVTIGARRQGEVIYGRPGKILTPSTGRVRV